MRRKPPQTCRGAQDGARVSHEKSLIYKGKSRYSLQARANTVRPYKFRGYAVKLLFALLFKKC
jgi:hypothetical protein